MSPTNEVIVIKRQHRIGGVEEFRMENDLHPIGGVVEHMDTAKLVQDRVFRIMGHVVSDDGREAMSLHSKQPAAQQHAVLACDKVLFVRHVVAFSPCETTLIHPLPHSLLDDLNGVPERLDYRLPFECLDGQRGRLSRHDDESDNGQFGAAGL